MTNAPIGTPHKYPAKERIPVALACCLCLLALTTKHWSLEPSSWHYDPADMIVICASTLACLFKPRGRWNLFFFGVAVGDLLLKFFLTPPN
jgi:hypothetical protein